MNFTMAEGFLSTLRLMLTVTVIRLWIFVVSTLVMGILCVCVVPAVSSRMMPAAIIWSRAAGMPFGDGWQA
jgi:hypothetical protein